MMNRMVKKDFAQEIAAVIRTAKNGDRLPELLKHYHWRDVAKAITLLADAERERLFRQMDAQTLAEIFPYLDDASRYLAELEGCCRDIPVRLFHPSLSPLLGAVRMAAHAAGAEETEDFLANLALPPETALDLRK